MTTEYKKENGKIYSREVQPWREVDVPATVQNIDTAILNLQARKGALTAIAQPVQDVNPDAPQENPMD